MNEIERMTGDFIRRVEAVIDEGARRRIRSLFGVEPPAPSRRPAVRITDQIVALNDEGVGDEHISDRLGIPLRRVVQVLRWRGLR